MTHATTSIRPATLHDVDAVVPLFDAYRQFYAQPSDPARARQFLVERLGRSESTLLVAESPARAALGFAQLFPTFSSVSLAPCFILNDLFVVPEFRRHGVGRALLAGAVEHCRSVGAVRVSLSTAVTNAAAQRLYAASGWALQTDYQVYVHRL